MRRLAVHWAGTWRFACVAAIWLLLGASRSAYASSINAQGELVFDSSAVLTCGFESLSQAQSLGASWVSWDSTTSYPNLTATLIRATDWSASIVTSSNALEGASALRIASGSNLGLALVGAQLFDRFKTDRVTISMWGRSFGAEPELDVVYPSARASVGPSGSARIVAVRTGNETSDGWVEYSTGPIDGALVGEYAIASIILTARYSTTGDTVALDDLSLAPDVEGPTIIDPSGYAVIDALEIDKVPGSTVFPTACNALNVDSVCGALGECVFGTCVDAALVWGAVPGASDQRTDLVHRLEFTAEYLEGSRDAAEVAPSLFPSAKVSALAGSTTPRAFYAGLNSVVADLHNGHTQLGSPAASSHTRLYPLVSAFGNPWSGYLDMCLGLATNDLPGGTGGPTYAVYWLAAKSVVAGTLQVGDMLVQVDGMTPDDWLAVIAPRYSPTLPDDPSSEPTGKGIELSYLLSRYASEAVFSSCTAAGTCAETTVPVAQISSELWKGTGYPDATYYSRYCSPRFENGVSAWTTEDDDAPYDVPLEATTGGIATVEFDGFEGAYDGVNANPYHAWQDPFSQAFVSGMPILIDARQGHGGSFFLGAWLPNGIRGTSDPYFAFAVPRGGFDDVDPSWLFDPSLASCVASPYDAPTICGWTGSDMDTSNQSSPAGGAVKIAWINGNDLSMNDIVPQKLSGATEVQIFGPHATTGAYGEISELPPIVGSWGPGSIQVLDMRFGASFGAAVEEGWASGVGVAPDQVVTQKVSDMLAGTDTVLAAAQAWLAP